MFASAAQDAMADANVKAKDIEALFLGMSMHTLLGRECSPQVAAADWIGMRGKPATMNEGLCITSYHTVAEAVMSVASGRYDIVVAGSCDPIDRYTNGKVPNYLMRPINEFIEAGGDFMTSAISPYYTRWNGGKHFNYDDCVARYIEDNNLDAETMDDVLSAAAINNRYNAEKNPGAIKQTPYLEEAKAAGFDDVKTYLKSKFNPFLTKYHRLSHFSAGGEQGTAMIICSADIAKQFNKTPVEVLGFSVNTMRVDLPSNVLRCTEEAIKQAYAMADVSPDEIDYLQVTDMILGAQPYLSEMVGYLPKGQAWKYILEGRTRYNGDKPINTNGGDTSGGHCPAPSGMENYIETVVQMRGEAGGRQIKNPPKTSFLRGEGGGHSAAATVLRVQA